MATNTDDNVVDIMEENNEEFKDLLASLDDDSHNYVKVNQHAEKNPLLNWEINARKQVNLDKTGKIDKNTELKMLRRKLIYNYIKSTRRLKAQEKILDELTAKFSQNKRLSNSTLN